MTKIHAANIHAKWKQQRELCEHPIQELVRVARSDDGVLLGTYQCRECGEAISYIDRSTPFSQAIARQIAFSKPSPDVCIL